MIKKKILDMENLVLNQEKKLIDLKNISKKKIQNILTRSKKEIEKTYKYSISKYIISILSDIDNLEKTIDLSIKENKHFSFIVYQLNKILKSFLNLFKIYNIHVINDINVPFDPNVHQAISISTSKTIKSNHIIMVMQKGYKIYNRLLRPAMVIVSK